VRASQPKVPTPAQIKASDPLQEAALDPCPQGVLDFEVYRLLPLACGQERLMVDLWADRELAGGCLGGGALPAGGTRATGGPVNPDTNDRIARHIVPRPPVDTGMALGTARLPGLPIDDKGLKVIAFPFPPLPTIGPERRTNHIDLMRCLGCDQEVGVHIAAVERGGPGRGGIGHRPPCPSAPQNA
jgi:hypothetical protein